MRQPSEHGFTVAELLTVVAVVGVLCSLGLPMLVSASPQTPALGAAIAAAVAAGPAAGGYDRFEAARDRMAAGTARTFVPDAAAGKVYDELYALYRELHDAFGGLAGTSLNAGSFMKRLLALRGRVASSKGGTP